MSNIPHNFDNLENLATEIRDAIIAWERKVYMGISGSFLAKKHLSLDLNLRTGLMVFTDIQIEKHSLGIDVTSFIPFIQAINSVFNYDQSVTAGINFCYTKVDEWLNTKN